MGWNHNWDENMTGLGLLWPGPHLPPLSLQPPHSLFPPLCSHFKTTLLWNYIILNDWGSQITWWHLSMTTFSGEQITINQVSQLHLYLDLDLIFLLFLFNLLILFFLHFALIASVQNLLLKCWKDDWKSK